MRGGPPYVVWIVAWLPPRDEQFQLFQGFDGFRSFNRFARGSVLRTFLQELSELGDASGCRLINGVCDRDEVKCNRCCCLDFEITRRAACDKATR
jgi:hypothetical protein